MAYDTDKTHAVPTARRVRELERDVRWLKKRVAEAEGNAFSLLDRVRGLEKANDQLYHAVETLSEKPTPGNDRSKQGY